jgi:hypothetical protein
LSLLEERFGGGRVWCRNPKFYEPEDVNEEVSVAVFLGLRDRGRDFLDHCQRVGIPCVVVDLGWLRRERGFWQVSVGELNRPPDVAPAGDRFAELQLNCYPRIEKDRSSLIVGQIPGDAQHDLVSGDDVIRWGRSVATTIRGMSRKRQIFWRPHPRFNCTLGPPAITVSAGQDLHEQLFYRNIGSAVVYNSTLGIELLRRGVNVVALGPRTVYSDLVPSSLAEIKGCHPGEQRVRSLLERLAYGQYKLSEFTWPTFEKVLELHNVTGDW